MKLKRFIETTICEYLNENNINGFNIDDIKIVINNFNDLFQNEKQFLNKKINFHGNEYDVSYEDNEYYIKEKRIENGDEYWAVLSPYDLKTTHQSLLNYLENKYIKQKNKTTVDVYYQNNKINYYDFNLELIDNNKIYVEYVNKSKDAPKITTAAYIKLAEKLKKLGFYLVSSKLQFSSGKLLWDRLEKEGYVKIVDGFKTLIPKK